MYSSDGSPRAAISYSTPSRSRRACPLSLNVGKKRREVPGILYLESGFGAACIARLLRSRLLLIEDVVDCCSLLSKASVGSSFRDPHAAHSTSW